MTDWAIGHARIGHGALGIGQRWVLPVDSCLLLADDFFLLGARARVRLAAVEVCLV
jgi:hypothetical protein